MLCIILNLIFLQSAISQPVNNGNKYAGRNTWNWEDQFRREDFQDTNFEEFNRPYRQNQMPSNQDNTKFGNGFDEQGTIWESNGKSPLNDNEGGFVFDDDFKFNNNNSSLTTTTVRPSTTAAVPGMATTRSACEDTCQATTQFDPVCGDNMVTYTNINWLRCAQNCGRNVQILYQGACPRTS